MIFTCKIYILCERYLNIILTCDSVYNTDMNIIYCYVCTVYNTICMLSATQ